MGFVNSKHAETDLEALLNPEIDLSYRPEKLTKD